jgi:CheY-like chemotaxis protein
VRSLVELHGGAVDVRSEGLGRGSEFRVSLPAPAGSPAPEPDAGPRPRAPRRVLVVDDNEDLAALVGELLQIHGHQVVVAHDGRSAIEAARRFRPEVALLDIDLPGMDGYQLAAELRSALDGILLVAITAYGQAVDRRRSADAGFTAHLLKPVDPQLLAQVVAAGPDRS